MGVFSENAIIGASNASGYDIDNSCRFDDGDSPYLTRTWPSDGNTLTWTWSCWIKRSNFTFQKLFDSATASQNSYFTTLSFNSDQLEFYNKTSSGVTVLSAAKYRDPGAWYHIMLVYDSPQATAANRTKMYVNGSLITLTGTYVNQNQASYMCDDSKRIDLFRRVSDGGSSYFDGYAAELHFIEGQALTPASFGETDVLTNEWKAIKYTGTYGTNGFFLEFKSSGALGTDTSGNGNNFTVNNLAATDQMIDTPQNSTGGNFCTWNPLSGNGSSLSEGNLKGVGQQASTKALGWMGTIAPESGKWYWEVYCVTTGWETWMGVLPLSDPEVAKIPSQALNIYHVDGAYSYYIDGTKIEGLGFTTGSTASSYGNSWTNGDIVGIALDLDNGAIYFSKNGTWQNSGDPTSGASKTGAAFTSFSGNYVPFAAGYRQSGVDSVWTGNWGQDSSFAGAKTAQGNSDGNDCGDFYYSPPSGYLTLCSNNLSDPAIALPGEHFNTVLYTANQSTNAISGVGFQPNFTWVKNRTIAQNNALFDSVRGVNKQLRSDTTGAQLTAYSDLLTSFDSDGFTLGADASVGDVNYLSGNSYVSWNWKAPTTFDPTSDGTIAVASGKSNATAGFSIVKYTGENAVKTIGHGLSVAPTLIYVKALVTHQWECYYLRPDGSDGVLFLDQDGDGEAAGSGYWNDTNPTASVFTVGTGSGTGGLTSDYIAYCFHSVEGYSKQGLYTGNGNADGAFIYTGFRPAYILIKRTDADNDWRIFDNKRDPYNVGYRRLQANLNYAEGTETWNEHDFVSNGFKWRVSDGGYNASGGTYLYLAFAESPFKTARAR